MCINERGQPKREDILSSRIGEIGRWQLIIFILLTVPIKLCAYTMPLGIIFMAPKTNFKCVEINNHSTEDIVNGTCYSECVLYDYYSQFEKTIISQWGLVCERAWLVNFSQTVYMCGVLFGSVLFGFISDRFGRRPALLISSMIQAIASFATAFCNELWMFTVIRFLIGGATGGNMIIAFVIITEIIGPSYRELMTCLYHVPFGIAEILMPFVAFYTKSWDKFSIGIACPTLLYVIYFYAIPESPKWALSVGKFNEACTIMEKAAKTNQLPTENMSVALKAIEQEAKVEQGSRKNTTSYLDLVKNPSLRYKNLCSCVIWFTLGVCFYGTSQYMGQTSSNVFITMSLAGAVKIPCILLTGVLYKRFGRRPTLIAFLTIEGICSCLLALPDTWFYMKLVAGAAGMGSAMGAYTVVYTYTSELFPTVTRNMAMGASSTASRLGSAIAPFVAGLKSEAQWIPPALFGVIPLLAIAASMMLPETKGKKLSDTLNECQ